MGLNGITARRCRNERSCGTHELIFRRAQNNIALYAVSLSEPQERIALFITRYKPAKWADYVRAEYLGHQVFRHAWISDIREAEQKDARGYRLDVAEDLGAEIADRVWRRAGSAGIWLDKNCLEWIAEEVREYTLNVLRLLWINGGKK